MKLNKIKQAIVLIILSTTGLVCLKLHADFLGDQARAGAATKAAEVSYENVTKVNKEIELKRGPISQAENLFEQLRQQQVQLKNKINATQKRLETMQQLIKQTDDKINQLVKKAIQKSEAAQPLFAVLKQANLAQEADKQQNAINALQVIINEVSALSKSRKSDLDKYQAAITALGGGS